MINQVFDEADIYIDSENLVALVEVKFHNTQLVEKGTTEGALVDTRNSNIEAYIYWRKISVLRLTTLTRSS